VCNSPWLIAAYHVLLRLSDPRHPPCALIRFKKFQYSLFQQVALPTAIKVTRYYYNFFFPICQRTSQLKATLVDV
jgi:hypothetical protein